MVSQPRRRRTTAPEPVPKSIPGPSPAPEWRLRLALGLLAISGLSALFNVLAVLALGGAIANLGAPQGPLDFALVFIGAVVGLGGDAVIVAGTLAVVRPGTRFAGHPERVSWGLGLQLLASALVGLLESSWHLPSSTCCYWRVWPICGYGPARPSPPNRSRATPSRSLSLSTTGNPIPR